MKTTVFDSLSAIPPKDWDRLCQQGSVAMSRAFWELIERSGMNDFIYRYIVGYEEGDPVVIAAVYTVTTDIAIFAPPLVRRLLGGVRKVLPHFLKWKMLECGTPITISSPPYIRSASVSDEAVIEALNRDFRRLAKRERCLIIVVRDFEPNAQALREPFRRLGYHWTDSLPNTYMEIRWRTPQEYRASMRSYFRSKLNKHLKRNLQAGVRHELVDDFAPLADTLCAQWLEVHTHASEFQREVLTPGFYRELPVYMGSLTKVLLFYKGDALVGHALLLRDGDMLRWLYVGREVAENDSLYIYVAETVVETAIELGARRLEMGLTTYPIKQDLGAEVVPINLAIRASWGLINPFVGLGYALLNKVPQPSPRQVFKAAEQEGRQA
ncbi:MAG: GNAT family N-acetyltransferase [Thiomonas sp.]|uniref:GNAT family N-acetyltransferase n=1 Tax=Thiomonas sp. TaxID=2047785 RepID=UPI002A36045F|nr:GNAT family N-acetyltransferase [Thiomonas sp.]MDY0331647.1 GNAT family N-acetyltransferase [Thiomonas sp.]